MPLTSIQGRAALPLALIGCGRWGKNILRDLKLLGAPVVVVARSEATRQRAIEGGADLVVSTIDQLPDISAFVVATPIPTHADVIDTLLPKGVPIFSEKPLCDDPARLAGWLQADTPIFVLDKWRYHPGIVALGEIARSGEFGPVLGLETRRLGWGKCEAGVSAVWSLTPHELAIEMEVLGRLLPLKSASLERRDGTVQGVHALLAADGVFHALDVSESTPGRSRSVRLTCRDAVIALTGAYADHIEIHRMPTSRAAEAERRSIATEFPLVLILRAVLAYLSGGPAPKSPVIDAATIVTRLAEIDRAGRE